MACGGLAEGGRLLPESSLDDPEPSTTQSDERATQFARGPGTDEESTARSTLPVGASRVGEACGPLGSEASKSAVVGEVELQEDARCGAGSACLMRAPAVDACRRGSGVVDCAEQVDEFVPVPPWITSEPAWEEGICTCRCDGSARDLDYCACPTGMRCEALIPSSGLNAAARPYVGSYCVF